MNNSHMTNRVRFIGPETDGLPPKYGQHGTLVNIPAPRSIRNTDETPEERQQLDEEFRRNHVMILWDGHTYPWDCPKDEFEYLKEVKS